MKLEILGCGTSTGVPIPGCMCEVCRSGHPRNNRTRTSALLRLDDGNNILIDASTDLRFQALRADVRNVQAVLFTHAHADHILGIDDLRAYNFLQGSSIRCYGTPATLDAIRHAFHYIFDTASSYEGGMLPQLELVEIEPFKPFELLGLRIEPFLLGHGSMDVTGFKIGRLAYATDCKTIPPQSRALLKGIDDLVLDGLRHEEHRTHMTIAQAIEASRELEAARTYLTHMTHSVDYETVSRDLPPGVQLCYDGLEIQAGPG